MSKLQSRVNAAGQAVYFAGDLAGNTVQLTDATGTPVNRYAFAPFGEKLLAIEAVPNAYQFGGRWGVSDDGNGLNYMRARYYSPVEGRFLSVDPRGWGLCNDYAYAQNNPLNFDDPSGAAALSNQQIEDNFQHKMNVGQDLVDRANKAASQETLPGSAPMTPRSGVRGWVMDHVSIFLGYFSATGPDVTTPVSTLASAGPGAGVGVFSTLGHLQQYRAAYDIAAAENASSAPKVGMRIRFSRRQTHRRARRAEPRTRTTRRGPISRGQPAGPARATILPVGPHRPWWCRPRTRTILSVRQVMGRRVTSRRMPPCSTRSTLRMFPLRPRRCSGWGSATR
jgi:RHS repeat-associated protein